MNKGMVYTSFAILASGLILLMASMPVNSDIQIQTSEAVRISEASFFLESVLADTDRSLSIATRRALTGSTNYVLETGNQLVKPKKNLTSALVNGSISNVELNSSENASLDQWKKKVKNIAERADYNLKVKLINTSFGSSSIEVTSSYTIFSRLEDPETLASFNETRITNVSVSIKGLEDTLILLRSKGRYISQYERCSFNDPANEIESGEFYSEAAIHGKAVVNPSDLSKVENKSDKILAVDDIDSYSVTDTDEFAGVVSAQENETTGYNDNYIYDLEEDEIEDVEDNMSIVLNGRKVWRTGFREMFQNNCYIPSERGPSIFDRFGNQLVSPEGDGLATLIEVTRLPSELQEIDSAVGYVYFNETGYGDLNKIRGVNSEYSWFRIDDYHVDLWGLNDLAY